MLFASDEFLSCKSGYTELDQLLLLFVGNKNIFFLGDDTIMREFHCLEHLICSLKVTCQKIIDSSFD